MEKEIKDTDFRTKCRNAKDRHRQNLIDKGWVFDGLWYTSPYTELRYSRREAIHVEELREWADGDSAFLKDREHSMWRKKEEEDNRVMTFEEAVENARKAQEIKKLGKG
jgi:hypothetical protein